MNKSYLIAIAAARMAAPLAFAHSPAGTPKDYCEPSSEWNTHEYATGTGAFILGNEDGNIGGNCSGTTNVNPGTPCAGFEDPADPLSFYAGLCDAEIDPPVADYDGHTEFATGGGWLYVCDSACGVSGAGAGTTECFGDAAHHGTFVTVDDVVLTNAVTFDVAADNVDAAAVAAGLPENECGDFESDVSQPCVGSCAIGFPAGLDGSYQVYVQGTAGHIVA